ncbi:3beta-hydroxysteroid-dehydrogenase/decarboxylase-like [Benincasa hispida]|uniref:3beta-hydroxysteroid- dehydrogenase/decarboxylase-like n=1 Tax=Benincasa hispida TaxID=102211 RepID=UPI001902039A|nr:3beta-hydroxysteroid-dehydrogenase/decarboxylase-like [Benincasa hispida]XP_038884193.1 3beta-hydroxysteroid-dehydrogenase/decarboxylase-like [Benincasa hispida]XP_038884195.1 3beta-hydroxysteroid-dehydrogenase/decarboxylase-like [Benincasa hispida]
MGSEEKWCVVTGGRGFAARHLVEMLIKYNMFSVRIVDLGSSIELEASEEQGILGEALRSGRAQYVSADLRDKAQVLKAFEGAEVVFHMAAPNSSINNYKLHYSVNVEGAKNVIDACVEQNVKRLIYTSSASVVFDGINGLTNADESMPYASKHNDFYSATKAEGEALVLKANGSSGLLTCSLRPSGIFGPGDRLLVPSLVANARAGKSKFIIGDGNNAYDFTYVENVAHAHVCAERALASGGIISEKAAGQAYFITNMEPIKFWEFVSLILDGLGYERPRIKIPACIVMPIAHMVNWTYKLLGPYGMPVPQFTPSRIRLLSCCRTFDSSKAKDRLFYTPIVSLQEGIQRTIEAYSHLKAEHEHKKEGPSKASAYLRGGTAADILLWKDKRKTLVALLVLVAIYYNFIAPESTMITALSKLLLVALIFLFIHGSLPEKIYGYRVEKISSSCFSLSEERSRSIAITVTSFWNSFIRHFKSLSRGNDWVLLLKVAVSLLALSFIGVISLQTLYKTVVLFAFTGFFLYEKKEQEIDSLCQRFQALIRSKCNVVGKVSTSKE